MSNAFGAQRVRPRDEVVIVDDSKQSRCKGQRGTGPITNVASVPASPAYADVSEKIVSRKPLGSLTSNARLFHSVS